MNKRNGIKLSVPNLKKHNRRRNPKNNEVDDELSDGINIVKSHVKKQTEEREKRIGKRVNQTIEEIDLEDEELELEDEYKEEVVSEIAEDYVEVDGKKAFLFSSSLILIIVIFYIFFNFGPIIGISLNKNMGISEDLRLDIGSNENEIYKVYNNELLIYSNQSIKTYDKNMDMVWEYKLQEQFTPDIYINGTYMILSNNSTGVIYLFNGKQELLNKKIDGNIKNIYLDEYGNMAIVYSSSEYKNVISVYDKEGKNLYNTYNLFSSIVDLKLIDNGLKLVVASSTTSSFKVSINIDLIDSTNSTNNMLELANLDNNFLYDLTIQGQNIIMLLDNGIYKCDINSKKVEAIKEFDKSQMLFITLNNNYYSYIEKNSKSNIYNIESRRFDNTVISKIESEYLPQILKSSGYLNHLISQTELKIINKWGVEVKNIDLNAPPKDILVFNKEKSVALIYTNKIYIINI